MLAFWAATGGVRGVPWQEIAGSGLIIIRGDAE